MVDEQLKNLPPEERIKKLKELEQKRKKEIEEAHQLIQQSEDEITERQKWEEKVPIPQVASEDVKELSTEEKEILKVHKGLKDKKFVEETTEKKAPSVKKEEVSLEETVEREQVRTTSDRLQGEYSLGGAPAQPVNMEYVAALSRKPMGDLYQEMSALNHDFREKGYLSQEEGRRIEYLTGAIDEKMKAVEAGRYSLTEEAAEAASITKQLGSQLRDAYHKKDKSSSVMHSWYKGV